MYFEICSAACSLAHAQIHVVPIVANVGVALIPTLLAGVATVAALLLKPRELLRLCRSKPSIPVLVAAGVALGGLMIGWSMSEEKKPNRRTGTRVSADTAAGGTTTDWTKVALALIQQQAANLPGSQSPGMPEQRAAVPPARLSPVPPTGTVASVFRGDYGRAGFAGGPAPKNLSLAWEYNEDNTLFLSSPLPVGDVVYGASCLLDPPTSYGTVFCLDAATGVKRWVLDHIVGAEGKEQDLKGFFSSPAVTSDGRFLVIGQGLHQDANSSLVCVEAATGRQHWAIPTPLHIEGSPAIDGDVVVAGAGAIEDEQTHLAVGNPGYVIAVRISDGKKLWEFPVADPESSPAVCAGVCYIGSGFNGSAVVALRTASNEDLVAARQERLVWRTATAYPATGAVTLAGDLVLVGCGNSDYIFAAKNPAGRVYGIDRTSGAIRWEAGMPDAVLGPIAVRDGVAFCPVRNGEVVALDVATGEVRWRQEDPAKRISRKAAALSGPALAGDLLFVTTNDGYLAVLDASNGSIVERVYANAVSKPGESGLTVSSPFVAGGRIFLGTETGGLRCYVGGPVPRAQP